MLYTCTEALYACITHELTCGTLYVPFTHVQKHCTHALCINPRAAHYTFALHMCRNIARIHCAWTHLWCIVRVSYTCAKTLHAVLRINSRAAHCAFALHRCIHIVRMHCACTHLRHIVRLSYTCARTLHAALRMSSPATHCTFALHMYRNAVRMHYALTHVWHIVRLLGTCAETLCTCITHELTCLTHVQNSRVAHSTFALRMYRNTVRIHYA